MSAEVNIEVHISNSTDATLKKPAVNGYATELAMDNSITTDFFHPELNNNSLTHNNGIHSTPFTTIGVAHSIPHSKRHESHSLGYDSGSNVSSSSVSSELDDLCEPCFVNTLNVTSKESSEELWEDVDPPLLSRLNKLHSQIRTRSTPQDIDKRSTTPGKVYDNSRSNLNGLNTYDLSNKTVYSSTGDKPIDTSVDNSMYHSVLPDELNHYLPNTHSYDGSEFTTDDDESHSSDASTRVYRKRFVSNAHLVHCEEHPDVKKALFCTDCAKPMCFWCKVKHHQHHKYTTIESAAMERRAMLKWHRKDLLKSQAQLEQKLKDFKAYQQDLHEKHKMTEKKLNIKQNYLHELVDRWYYKVKFEMEVVWGQEMNTLMAKIDAIELALDDMKESCDHMKQVISYRQPLDLLMLSKDMANNAEQLHDKDFGNIDQKTCFIFTSGISFDYDLFGNFTTSSTTISEKHSGLIAEGYLLTSFDSREGKRCAYMATGISVTPSNDLVVTDLGLDAVQVFSQKGRRLITLNNLPADEPTKAIMTENEIVVACKSSLKIFDLKGNFGHKVATISELPQGLVRNHNGDFVVTDTDEDGSCLIHIFAKADMRNLHTIIGGHRAPIFQKPWYTTIDLDNNIIISDYAEHRVQILNSVGMLICEFGHKGYRPGNFFHPAGMCVDKFGHILVADCYNSRVQLFSRIGEFLGVILNEENGLAYPTDIALDHENHLVVLQGNGEVKIFQYIF